MSETPQEAFGDEAATDAEQNFEIDSDGPAQKDVETQFNLDQASEIDPGGDEPLEPGDLPVDGG